ncbi:MAG: hypothetical protein N3D84_03820 [Candidatus Woesearchaeota archaeon]|nr:hypothetical protein [Candidatus Woesearchaeota archaeon]
MRSLVDFVSKVRMIFEGEYTYFPRYTLMRMAGRGRRERRIETKILDDIRKIKEDEQKGSITALKKDTRDFARSIKRELVIQKKEIKGEEKVEMALIDGLYKCLDAIHSEKSAVEKIRMAAEHLNSFSNLQLRAISQLKEGGMPWTGVAGIMKYNIQECSNIIITTSRSMRMDLSRILSIMKDIIKLGRDLKNMQRRKDAIQKVNKRADELVNAVKEFRGKMELHFWVTLRVYKFLLDDIKMTIEFIMKMPNEGLSLDIAKKLKKNIEDALKNYERDIKEEESDTINLVNQCNRLLSEAKAAERKAA